MAKFFANFAMGKISDLKVMDTETEVCPHYWLVNLVSLLKTEFSKSFSVANYHGKNDEIIFVFHFFRVDFLPAPKSGFGKNPQGCLRCGYSVYEAEKLIAAGRVSNPNMCTLHKIFFARVGNAVLHSYLRKLCQN